MRFFISQLRLEILESIKELRYVSDYGTNLSHLPKRTDLSKKQNKIRIRFFTLYYKLKSMEDNKEEDLILDYIYSLDSIITIKTLKNEYKDNLYKQAIKLYNFIRNHEEELKLFTNEITKTKQAIIRIILRLSSFYSFYASNVNIQNKSSRKSVNRKLQVLNEFLTYIETNYKERIRTSLSQFYLNGR